MRLFFALVVGMTVAAAQADPVRIRMAAVAPERTSWAREINTFSREVFDATDGKVQFKWYFGGIAGDELEALQRVGRGQLDGLAGTLGCSRAAPSLRVMRILGLFRTREEFRDIIGKLRPRIDAEMKQSGFADVGLGNFGNVIIFSRRPVRTMADLRAARIWSWNLDEVWMKLLPELAVPTVLGSVNDAERLYDSGRADGFFAFPTAALAFQWSARAHYYTDLRLSAMPACVMVALRTMDSLPLAHQAAIREAGARLNVRFEERGQLDDDALLGGLFERQGLTHIAVSAQLSSEFFEAARQARDNVGSKLVDPALLSQVLSWLADYRAEHAPRR